jgi:catechol 2,3-dioxygenase-like lactoylglutathione lyase family enzyme
MTSNAVQIIPNLMVTDMRRSVAFYRDVLGMTAVVMVAADRSLLTGDSAADAVFATLDCQGAQLMLQTSASLADDLDLFRPDQRPTASGTIYFRGLDPTAVVDRVAPDQITKGPLTQWYGMRELYLRDPDGHIICLGVPDGPAPG